MSFWQLCHWLVVEGSLFRKKRKLRNSNCVVTFDFLCTESLRSRAEPQPFTIGLHQSTAWSTSRKWRWQKIRRHKSRDDDSNHGFNVSPSPLNVLLFCLKFCVEFKSCSLRHDNGHPKPSWFGILNLYGLALLNPHWSAVGIMCLCSSWISVNPHLTLTGTPKLLSFGIHSPRWVSVSILISKYEFKWIPCITMTRTP